MFKKSEQGNGLFRKWRKVIRRWRLHLCEIYNSSFTLIYSVIAEADYGKFRNNGREETHYEVQMTIRKCTNAAMVDEKQILEQEYEEWYHNL